MGFQYAAAYDGHLCQRRSAAATSLLNIDNATESGGKNMHILLKYRLPDNGVDVYVCPANARADRVREDEEPCDGRAAPTRWQW